MKTLSLLALLLAALLAPFSLGGCATPAPHSVQLPQPFERHGLHVKVSDLLRAVTFIRGVGGVDTNMTAEPMGPCRLQFDILDDQGRRIAVAIAETDGIGPGSFWPFRADFDNKDVQHIRSVVTKSVKVGKPPAEASAGGQ